MNAPKHTPGPWWLAGKATVRFGDKAASGWIANVHWRNRSANATLITAAPDLLEAATEAYRYVNKPSNLTPTEVFALFDKLSEAITKATGEQP